MSGAVGSLKFLSQSAARPEILQLLQTEQGLDRYEIESQIEASRRTVIRILDELIERGYITNVDDEYRLTALGSVLINSYLMFAEKAELARSFAPFLTQLPDDIFEFKIQYLENAELVTATEGSPYAVLDRTLTIRRQASRIREISPIIEHKSVQQLARRVRNDETISVEIILSESAIEASSNHPEYQQAQQVVTQADQTTIHVTAKYVHFLLCIADETVAIGSMAERKPHALVVSTDTDVRQWAEQVFRSYQESAQPVR